MICTQEMRVQFPECRCEAMLRLCRLEMQPTGEWKARLSDHPGGANRFVAIRKAFRRNTNDVGSIGADDALLITSFGITSGSFQQSINLCLQRMTKIAFDQILLLRPDSQLVNKTHKFYHILIHFVRNNRVKQLELPTWMYVQVLTVLVLLSSRDILALIPHAGRKLADDTFDRDRFDEMLCLKNFVFDYQGRSFAQRLSRLLMSYDDPSYKDASKNMIRNIISSSFMAIYRPLLQRVNANNFRIASVRDARQWLQPTILEHRLACRWRYGYFIDRLTRNDK